MAAADAEAARARGVKAGMAGGCGEDDKAASDIGEGDSNELRRDAMPLRPGPAAAPAPGPGPPTTELEAGT